MAVSEPRLRERWLLAAALGVLAVLTAGLAAQRWHAGAPLLRGAEATALTAYVLGLLAVHLLLGRMGIRGDEAIVPIVGLLAGLGLLLRLRLTPLHTGWPAAATVVLVAQAALVAAVWVCRQRLRWLDRAAWPCGLAAVVLMAYLLRHGVQFRGALYGPGLTTPTELLKPLLVVFLAGFLKRRRHPAELLAFAAIWLAVQAALVKQSDLGLVLILGCLVGIR